MATGKTIVPTIEEIQERNRLRAMKTPAKGSGEPCIVQVPEPIKGEDPIKAHAVRIETPPVGLIATDQTPNQTLAPGNMKMVAPIKDTVAQILARHDLDPVEEMLSMYNERVEDPDSPDYGRFVMTRAERLSIMREILKYQHPTLKAVEHTGDRESNRITVVLQMPDGSRSEKEIAARGKIIDA